MPLVAVTNINDGERVVAAGETVSSKTFDKDVLDHLKEIGSVQEYVVPDVDPDERDAEIAKLQARIAELEGGAKGPLGPETPQSNPAGTSKPKDSK